MYINENPTNSSLFLDPTGVALTLTCGTFLRFLLQKGTNLPIMLTQEALNKPKSKYARVPIRNPIINLLQFLCSTTYAIFMISTILHSVDELSVLVSSSASEDAVFKQANINLSPEQRELLLWHYRLSLSTSNMSNPYSKNHLRESHVLSSLVITNVRIANNLCVQCANMPSKNNANHLKHNNSSTHSNYWLS